MKRAIWTILVLLIASISTRVRAQEVTAGDTTTYHVKTATGQDSLAFRTVVYSSPVAAKPHTLFSGSHAYASYVIGPGTRVWKESFLWMTFLCVGETTISTEVFGTGHTVKTYEASPKCKLRIRMRRGQTFCWLTAVGDQCKPIEVTYLQTSEAFIPPHR